MSVAAMKMDEQRHQRPMMNAYDKMPIKYEQNVVAPSGPASPTGSEEPTSGASVSQQQQQYHYASHHSQHHQYHHTAHHLHHPHHHHHHHQEPPVESQQQSSLQQQPTTVAVSDAVAAAEQRQRLLEDEIESLKLEQTRLSQQCSDAQRREKILMRRLANKEQEFQDYVSQIAEYKAAQAPSALALRSALLDPAVNLLFEKLKKELKATKAKLEETQNELSAWKFTPDSNTGKRLMAKCRLLYQENEELGKMTSNGRLAKLETELAMQKSFSEEVKKSQSELDDFLQELDEDVEGMQSTILFLQQELKTTRDRIQSLEKENFQLKNSADCISGDACNRDAAGEVTPNAKADPQKVTLALNGRTTTLEDDATVTPYNNQAIPAVDAAIEPKFQAALTTALSTSANFSLETIDEENACVLRSSSASTTTELYNGSENTQLTAAPDAEGGMGGLVGAGKLRTMASRKRNYESSDVNENIAPIVVAAAAIPTNSDVVGVVAASPHVSSPRTLPPKKSKLRTLPLRRSSVQSVELSEAVADGAAVDPLNLGIVDNAVVGMANEELPVGGIGGCSSVLVDNVGDGPGAVGVAQRIMTRRRSVRTQQNGGVLDV